MGKPSNSSQLNGVTAQTGNNHLLALAGLVSSSVDAIVHACKAQPFPSADEPFSLESDAIRMDPEVQKHSGVLVAAATQLVAAVRPPPLALLIHGITVRAILLGRSQQ